MAESRGHPIAIGDERAIRRAKKRNPNFETLGTMEILILWQERNGVANERMGQLLQSIFPPRPIPTRRVTSAFWVVAAMLGWVMTTASQEDL